MRAAGYARYGYHLTGFAARVGAGWLAAGVRGRRRGFDSWAYVPDLLQDLGPAFVKMGQLASTRRDLLGERARVALSRLREDCRPLPGACVGASVDDIHHRPPDEPLRPLGYGSIAGVYHARFADGPLAVKIRRPDVADRLRFDADSARRFARAMAWLPPVRKLPLREMVDFLATAAEMQVDFKLEGRNLEELRRTLDHLPVRLPEPRPDLSDDERLVMEYLPAFAAAEAAVPDGTTSAIRLLEAVFTMIFRSGFVHLDMHSGNFAFDDDGTLNIVDAGFAVQLSDRTRRQFSEFFIGLSFGNGKRSADSILRSAVRLPPDLDREAFTAEIAGLIGTHRRLPARDFRVGAFTAELFAIQRRHGVFISSEFAAPVLALLTIEEQIRQWAPDLDFQVVAQAIILASIALIPCGPE
jgi:ubiquinone biosynthesis protein